VAVPWRQREPRVATDPQPRIDHGAPIRLSLRSPLARSTRQWTDMVGHPRCYDGRTHVLSRPQEPGRRLALPARHSRSRRRSRRRLGRLGLR
jgi:hypothetical protein